MRSKRTVALGQRIRSTSLGAFTLLELMVVVAVITILASILLPALAKSKVRGERILCLNNTRQLALAWMLYSGDNEDRLPHNYGAADTKRTIVEKTYQNWVNNIMSWGLEGENTNTTLVMTGGLGPYTQGSIKVYRCPADSALSDLQEDAGWSTRTRSMSMNAMVGDAGEFSRDGAGNVNNPYYRQFFTLSDIPNPSDIFVFIEEHPDSINDGYFLNKAKFREWNDLPASYHDGAANLSFADGHAETRQWRFASTKRPSRPNATQLPAVIPSDELGDFYWLMQRMSHKSYDQYPSAGGGH